MITRYLEPEQVAGVANALPSRLRPIWLLMYATGMRVSDVIKLRECDIDTDGVVHWTAQKTGKSASRKLPGEVLAVIPRACNDSEEWLFRSEKNPAKHIHRSTLFRHIKKACIKCGINPEGVGTHTARKSFAVKDYRENGLGKTMHDLQHSNASTTLFYALSDNPIPRVFQKLKEIDEKLTEFGEILDLLINAIFPPDEPLNVRISDEKGS